MSQSAKKTSQSSASGIPPWQAIDWLIWSAVALLAVASIVLSLWFKDLNIGVRLGGWVFFACASAGLVWSAPTGRAMLSFAYEAYQQLQQVVWPSREETTQVTLIVAAMVVTTAVILWGFDSLLLSLVAFVV